MSKSALMFITLAIMAIAMNMLLPAQASALDTASKVGAGLFFSFFVIALVMGRRFKFDPVLR